jgi:hypothetical protein
MHVSALEWSHCSMVPMRLKGLHLGNTNCRPRHYHKVSLHPSDLSELRLTVLKKSSDHSVFNRVCGLKNISKRLQCLMAALS